MNSGLTRMFECLGGYGWWIIVLFFLFIAFQECWSEIGIIDWIPFLILLLIVCACNTEDDYNNCDCIDNNTNCNYCC